MRSGSNVWDISRKGSAAPSSEKLELDADTGTEHMPLQRLHSGTADHSSQAAEAQHEQVDT